MKAEGHNHIKGDDKAHALWSCVWRFTNSAEPVYALSACLEGHA